MPGTYDNKSSRIVVIDALRGFALLGILLAHISHWFAAGPLPADVHGAASGAAEAAKDITNLSSFKIPEFINAAFVNGKFYPLFTFIFGFSFFLQIKSFTRDNENVNLLFFRRAIFLFIIGFVHQLFWMGDILMIYAILMIPLIFLRKLSDKSLLVFGLLLVFNIPGIILEIVQVFNHTRVLAEESHEADRFLHVISQGSWGEIISFNYHSIAGKMKFQAISGRFFITLGFFFLGMLTARKGWLKLIETPAVKDRIYSIFLPAYAIMILLQLLTYKLNYADSSSNIAEIIIGNVIISVQSLCAIILYTSFVAILYYTQHIHHLFDSLARLGRAALTSYLMQTIFGLFLFYHVGFGLFGKTSHIVNALIGLAFFILQILHANFMFTFFNYGFIEWLLRGVTHWKFQKLKK